MTAVDIEKLNQLISRTDISGNDKVRWLTDFIDGREFEQQERMYSKEEIKPLLSFIREIKDNWDCDEDSHKYNTICRCCDAEKTLIGFEYKSL